MPLPVFSQYGLVIHELLESYWNYDLDLWDLPLAFEEKYSKQVTARPPKMLIRYNTMQKYYEKALEFFTDLDWSRSEWEVLGNEYTVDCEYEGVQLTIRPDLIIKNKESGLVYLVDYKSTSPFTKKLGKPQKKKMLGYWRQLSLYAYFTEKEMGIKIDKLRLYFPRVGLDKTQEVDYTEAMAKETLDWWLDLVNQAKDEEAFPPKVQSFFCENICSVRNSCIHWKTK